MEKSSETQELVDLILRTCTINSHICKFTLIDLMWKAESFNLQIDNNQNTHVFNSKLQINGYNCFKLHSQKLKIQTKMCITFLLLYFSFKSRHLKPLISCSTPWLCYVFCNIDDALLTCALVKADAREQNQRVGMRLFYWLIHDQWNSQQNGYSL